MNRDYNGNALVPGVNVDKIDIAAGLKEMKAAGWDDQYTTMVIHHSLLLWARGEETSAQKKATDQTFHGVNLISWIRILAAARAAGERKVNHE